VPILYARNPRLFVSEGEMVVFLADRATSIKEVRKTCKIISDMSNENLDIFDSQKSSDKEDSVAVCVKEPLLLESSIVLVHSDGRIFLDSILYSAAWSKPVEPISVKLVFENGVICGQFSDLTWKTKDHQRGNPSGSYGGGVPNIFTVEAESFFKKNKINLEAASGEYAVSILKKGNETLFYFGPKGVQKAEPEKGIFDV